MPTGGRAVGSPATAFRIALLVLCSVLSVLADQRTYAALPVALLAAFALASERVPVVRRNPLVANLGEALFTGLAVTWTGAADSPMLPYLLAPTLATGLAGTSIEVALVSGAAVLGLTAGAVSVRPAGLDDYAQACLQWVLLGLALGLVAGWAQRLTPPTPGPAADRYAEVRSLLEELRRITQRLPGGLDVTSSAEAMLHACAELVPSVRSAVLVQPTASGALVPAAVRGTQRVPWRAPVTSPGPLQQAWDSGEPVVERRRGDTPGRRRGSTLAVLPILSGGESFGLVILESFEQGAFTEPEVEQLAACVMERAVRLETAVLFDSVRSTVTVEERDRLAREMHDGVAQELAYVGYQLDALRGQAAKIDPTMATAISDVRKGLTRLISDIRLSITDLRTSVSNDRGLGAALSGYVRAVGSGQQVTVHLSLQESVFRLPGEQEVLLFQIAQAVAQDVRRGEQAANLWVTLEVDPPSARLLVEHDLQDGEHAVDLQDFAGQMGQLGGTLRTGARTGTGVWVEAVLQGGDRGGASPAGR